MLKRCTECGKEKNDSEFHTDRSRKTGLRERCKHCTVQAAAARRAAHPEKALAISEGYRQRHPERGCWTLMKSRCYNPRDKNYQVYGGSGITVCDRWRASFDDFLADVGPRPSLLHSLDRYPNQSGNYEPGNVRWATQKQQTRNMRTNHLVSAFGKTQCLADWATELGLKQGQIQNRLRLGWSIERLFTEPIQPQRRKLQAFGETLTVAEWARRHGVHPQTILKRLSSGVDVELAISAPAVKGKRLNNHEGEKP